MTFHGISLFVTSKIIPLALSIIGFGLLIVVHELGHFIFCKAFGIHTPTFSIGFGPKIVEKDFWCIINTKKFTKEEVEEICEVGGKIHV